MGVYIKGMEMPKSCGECNDRHIYDLMWKLGLCQDSDTDDYSGCVCVGRANCPLDELPPHGDLIERVPTITKIQKIEEEPQYQHEGEDWINGLIQAEEIVRYAPTVLEAEGKDDV